MLIRPFSSQDTNTVIALWESAGPKRPWTSPRLDTERNAPVQPELFAVAEGEDGAVLDTVLAGHDGHRGWVNYLATSLDDREIGSGRALVEHGATALRALGCPKANLQVRTSNAQAVEFYRHLGYDVDEAIALGKRLIAD